jgi:hypothetical protein
VKEMRIMWFEDQKAERAVREGLVGIVCVVPVLEGGEVEMYAIHRRVAGVVACGESEQVALV